MRTAARVDATQEAIVKTLRAAGVAVYPIKLPCDLLCKRGDDIYVLDCDGITRNRKRDPKQLENFKKFGVRIVKTPEEALRAVGL